MYYKIGVDVGGTNTDAVLVTSDNKIISKTKQTTTSDVGTGIKNALQEVLREQNIPKKSIKYVMLGTTHCTNALVERKELDAIGAIRIGLPASSAIPTMTDFPEDLKELLGQHLYMVHGGYEFDGRPIHILNEDEVKACLTKMKGKINALAITGIFSKSLPDQELRVAQWAREVLGDKLRISCSHQIGGLGLLERENATILNAALQGVARKMVTAFKETVVHLGLTPDLFIGQNDGTLMSLDQVQDYPVLTISSGPTNSIRGAGVLSQVKDAIVIDVGGTTSDGGVLVNHFPRESTQAAQIGGVYTNFRMPDVVAIGIGGGTIVRFKNDRCILGPDSVGYKLKEQSISFGGNTLTISDFFLASETLHIKESKDVEKIKEAITHSSGEDFLITFEKVKDSIKDAVERLVDKLKTDAKDIPVIACGGGAFLLPKKIDGASEVIFPDNREVANAFGACIAQISSDSEIVINTLQKNESEEMNTLIHGVEENLIDKGAVKETIHVITKESIPLAYLPGAVKLKVKLCGALQ